MYMHSKGTRAEGDPLFVLLAGGGAPGIALSGVHEELLFRDIEPIFSSFCETQSH